MGNNKEKFRNYVMQFSYREKREKELESFKREVRRLRSMDEDELNFEYIKLKAEYERKKSKLTLFVISIGLAVLMNAWSKVFSFMNMALQYAASVEGNSTEIMTVSIGISAIVLLFVTAIILFILTTVSNDMNEIKRKLMIIEDVIKKEKESSEND